MLSCYVTAWLTEGQSCHLKNVPETSGQDGSYNNHILFLWGKQRHEIVHSDTISNIYLQIYMYFTKQNFCGIFSTHMRNFILNWFQNLGVPHITTNIPKLWACMHATSYIIVSHKSHSMYRDRHRKKPNGEHDQIYAMQYWMNISPSTLTCLNKRTNKYNTARDSTKILITINRDVLRTESRWWQSYAKT